MKIYIIYIIIIYIYIYVESCHLLNNFGDIAGYFPIIPIYNEFLLLRGTPEQFKIALNESFTFWEVNR